MTITEAVPHPDAPGSAPQTPAPGDSRSRMPGPLRFLGRTVRTLWGNGKARIGVESLKP